MSSKIILLILLIYFATLLVISWITSRKSNNDSFFIGNRKSPWFIVAFGMVGASLSGVTFVSVPGWVVDSNFYYMQVVFGYLLGYLVIILVLLPLYYRLQLTSIYTYLEQRFGQVSYKTGATFFLISRLIGAAFRLFLVANVLQITVFDYWQVPFYLTVILTILLIWLYTFRGGIKTIIWTDTLQTFFMLSALVLTLVFIAKELQLNFSGLISTIRADEHSTIFEFNDWQSPYFFLKQFISGAFITIVMTGLDQDMMQKNLSCRNLFDAQKNMLTYSLAFVPVNLAFLALGVLLLIFAQVNGIVLPDRSDDIFPLIATSGLLPPLVGVMFILGLIAAAYSSADSALTSLTTSFTVDIVGVKNKDEKKVRNIRGGAHIFMSLLLLLIILLFRSFSDQSVISSLFMAAGYTYGPLLGLFAFGMLTTRKVKDKWVPLAAIACPILSYIINYYSESLLWGYKFGFEILIVNGLLMFFSLLLFLSRSVQK